MNSKYDLVALNVPPLKDITAGPKNARRRERVSMIRAYDVAEEKSVIIPKTVAEAKSTPEWPMWELAIMEELQSIKDNGTGILVPPPNDKNIIDSKIVFDLKTDDKGQITRFKARNVARGFTQEKGIDYYETASPVIKAVSLKLLLSIAAAEDMDIEQMDVKTAFLIPRLKEDLYLRQTIFFKSELGQLSPHRRY